MDEPQLTFEQAQGELHEIVQRLERGNVSLQDSLDLWKRGEELVARCEAILAAAQQRIDAAKATPAEAD